MLTGTVARHEAVAVLPSVIPLPEGDYGGVFTCVSVFVVWIRCTATFGRTTRRRDDDNRLRVHPRFMNVIVQGSVLVFLGLISWSMQAFVRELLC